MYILVGTQSEWIAAGLWGLEGIKQDSSKDAATRGCTGAWLFWMLSFSLALTRQPGLAGKGIRDGSEGGRKGEEGGEGRGGEGRDGRQHDVRGVNLSGQTHTLTHTHRYCEGSFI